jgi:signal peptidase
MRVIARATTFVRRVVDLGLLALIGIVLVTVVLAKGAPLVGRQSIVIGGGSMEPTIPLGSAIVVRPVDGATLAVGDVVSMQVGSEHTTYTHRIIDLVDRPDGRWIRTKGDANPDPDPSLVPVSAVIGKVELTVPLVGYLVALLSLPIGVVFVLGLAATLLAIAWLLESLEPARVVARVTSRDVAGSAAADAEVSAAPPAKRPKRTAIAPPAPVGEADPALARGEPIAARPSLIALPLVSTFATAFAGPSLITRQADVSVARPTVREQLARSREVRNRRARWERAGGRRRIDRSTLD